MIIYKATNKIKIITHVNTVSSLESDFFEDVTTKTYLLNIN